MGRSVQTLVETLVEAIRERKVLVYLPFFFALTALVFTTTSAAK